MDFVKVKEMAKMASQQNNCRVYDIHKHRDRLQVFIDKKDQDVNLKDCENVFHSLRFLLMSELPYVLENKRLEISSPGVEKQLREPWHFEESIGKSIKLTVHSPLEVQNKKTGHRFRSQSFTGEIKGVSSTHLTLQALQWELPIPFSKIKSAYQIFSNKKK